LRIQNKYVSLHHNNKQIEIMNPIVAKELSKYTKATDKVVEVETTTNNHYSLNYRFEVTRENKKYFIAIKEVDVMGEIKKHHTRLEVDTDLEKTIEPKKVDLEKIEKIKKELEKLKKVRSVFEERENFKNNCEWYMVSKKITNLERKL
jgi:hypothetical protein